MGSASRGRKLGRIKDEGQLQEKRTHRKATIRRGALPSDEKRLANPEVYEKNLVNRPLGFKRNKRGKTQIDVEYKHHNGSSVSLFPWRGQN